MDILKIVLYIIFVIDCIALSAIILLQEQGTFYGRCTCKVYKVSCYPFPGACSSTEP